MQIIGLYWCHGRQYDWRKNQSYMPKILFNTLFRLFDVYSRHTGFCGLLNVDHHHDGSMDQYRFFVFMVGRSKILISQQLQESHLRSAVSFDGIEMTFIFIVDEFMQHQLFSWLIVSDCRLKLQRLYYLKHILPKQCCPLVSRQTLLQLKIKIGFQKQ